MFKKHLILLFMLFLGAGMYGQNKGTGPKEQGARQEINVRKQQRRESREKRKLEKAEKKKIKQHHKKLQTKKVQKRMKKSRKKAIRNNENKREFFLKRWFSRK